MAIIRPFKAIRPTRDKASLVASRSYVTYSKSSLKDKLDTNPYTFLHIINPDYLDNQSKSKNEKFKLTKDRFNEFLEKEILFKEKEESFYIYEQIREQKKFIGIIASVSIDEYTNKKIKIHEETITKREEMFKNYLDIVGFNADPVLLTYTDNQIIDQIINEYSENRAEYEFTTTNKVYHRLWKISDNMLIKKITNVFKTIDSLYIADGHHRSASSSLLLKQRRENNPNLNKNDNVNYFMSYLIPSSQLEIINFNRLVKLKKDINAKEIIHRIAKAYIIKDMGKEPYSPNKEKEISMYIKGNWYSLTYNSKKSQLISENLDASILSKNILSNILNIKDEKTDKNIHFLEGKIPLTNIKKKVDNKEFDIAFILQPINIQDLKKVSDDNEIMPPKSTYINPKLRSGLTIYKID